MTAGMSTTPNMKKPTADWPSDPLQSAFGRWSGRHTVKAFVGLWHQADVEIGRKQFRRPSLATNRRSGLMLVCALTEIYRLSMQASLAGIRRAGRIGVMCGCG